MSNGARSNDSAAQEAARELARLGELTAQARATLTRLQQRVLRAQQLASSSAAHLLEANEQLVLAALRGQEKAEAAAQARETVASAQLAALAKLVGHERRNAQLEQANAQLVLDALSAQDVHAAAQEAQRRQNEFLGVLAHELRNPLAPIRNAAAILGRIPTSEPMLAKVQSIIENQVVHISRLVGDLLDVSRVNTGKLRLERRGVDLLALIEEVIDSGRPALEARNQQLDLQLPPGPLELHGDPVRLAQIFSNLLDNASKYTPNGGAIGVAVTVVDAAIVVTVYDLGIGITADALPHIFEPFVQDIHATVFNGVGLGIGLTVVRELVEAHGGTVLATSGGKGKGSQFKVTLPLPRQDPAH